MRNISFLKPQDSTDDFLGKSFLGVACVSLVLLTPFSINNFVQGRYAMGFGSVLITCILAFNAWSTARHNRYYATLTLLGLVPSILFFLALSIKTQGMIGVFWCYPAAVTFYFILPERKAWFANAALLILILPLVWQVIEPRLATRLIATLTMISILSGIFIRVISEQQQTLKRQAVTDPLTGLLNRTLLPDTLAQTHAQSRRTGTPVTLVTLDIDFFKAINDSFGHDVGDRVIQEISQLVLSRIRLADRAFRLGGEEFLVLLHGTSAPEARQVAEELRGAIAQLQSIPNYPVTVSAGIAELQPSESWQAWMKRSDESLYRAKQSGRNRVEV